MSVVVYPSSSPADEETSDELCGRPPWSSSLALSLMTLVVAGGLGRLFQGYSYLVPVLASAAAAHGAAALWRRLRLGTLPSLALSSAVATLVSVWAVVPDSTWYGVPVPRTVHAVGRALAGGAAAFHSVASPAPPLPGLLLVAVWAVAAAAIAADALLAGARATLDACIPSFVLFVFTAALGTSRGWTLATATYLAALLGFLLTEETSRQTSSSRWLGGRRQPTRRRRFAVGAALGGVAVGVACLVGPKVPGAGSAPLFSWHHQRQEASPGRVALSPLVSLKAELLSPPQVQVFSVAASRPSYWRLTALDHFDGEAWSSNQAYRETPGRLAPSESPSALVTQSYQIDSLSSDWLPAAYRPVRVSGAHGALYDASSSSLLTTPATAPGLRYWVQSLVPALTAAELRQARVDPNDPRLAPDLELPADLPRSVVRLARQVVKRHSTPYGEALALQDFFRDNFTYSLAPPPDDSVQALVQFLFVTRAGYCQQFAGAYAVMARAVGLPARVAVGFTPGQLGPDGRYHVLALDAHAWPEVFLGRYGWVPFEPTVARGEPGTEAYTGVAAEQATLTEPLVQASPVTTTSPPPTPAAGAPSHATRPSLVRKEAGVERGMRFVPALLGGLGGTALALAAALVLAPRLRRARRRSRARGPDRVLVAFSEAAEALGRRGAHRRPSESFGRYAGRAALHCPPDARPALAELARAAEAAVYSPKLPSPAEVADAVSASEALRRSLRRPPGLRLGLGLRPRGGTAPGPDP